MFCISSVQFSSVAQSCPHESQHTRPPCPSPTPGVHSDSHPSSQRCLPAISSSVIPFSSCSQALPGSVFSNKSTLCMRCPKYWSFSFSIIPSKEIPGLISFRMDWLDLLAVQEYSIHLCLFYCLIYRVGRKVMTNLDSILKSRDISLPTKVHLVKALVFPVVMYGCESWTVKKAERQRIDAFGLWYWRRLLRVPWTARRSNQSILKEISPGISLEGMMLKLKLQVLWPPHVKS